MKAPSNATILTISSQLEQEMKAKMAEHAHENEDTPCEHCQFGIDILHSDEFVRLLARAIQIGDMPKPLQVIFVEDLKHLGMTMFMLGYRVGRLDAMNDMMEEQARMSQANGGQG